MTEKNMFDLSGKVALVTAGGRGLGGLLSSTLLTLIVLPYVSDTIERVVEWAGHLWSASAPGQAPAAAVVSEAPPVS